MGAVRWAAQSYLGAVQAAGLLSETIPCARSLVLLPYVSVPEFAASSNSSSHGTSSSCEGGDASRSSAVLQGHSGLSWISSSLGVARRLHVLAEPVAQVCGTSSSTSKIRSGSSYDVAFPSFLPPAIADMLRRMLDGIWLAVPKKKVPRSRKRRRNFRAYRNKLPDIKQVWQCQYVLLASP
eukprot:scaffold1_cov402-Prasinococcus_capsulatus_cf.AAC.56